MAHGPRYSVPFRRRREGKTNFRTRAALLKSGKPRIVVRKTLSKIIVQVIEYSPKGDKIIASSTSIDLKKYGWSASTKSTSAAYLTGLLAGKRAQKKGVSEGVLDIGLNYPSKGAKVFGALKGVLDSGIDIPHGEGMFPGDDRISGKTIDDTTAAMFDKVKAKLEEA